MFIWHYYSQTILSGWLQQQIALALALTFINESMTWDWHWHWHSLMNQWHGQIKWGCKWWRREKPTDLLFLVWKRWWNTSSSYIAQWAHWKKTQIQIKLDPFRWYGTPWSFYSMMNLHLSKRFIDGEILKFLLGSCYSK